MSSIQEIQFALSRINRVLASKRTPGYRDIRLGLDRINRVVPENQDWKGIHVAGTNGKGSICTFLAGLFKLAGLGYGSFTSPAFPEKHNGIIINGLYVNPRMYDMETKHVEEKYSRISAGWRYKHGEDPPSLTPFEVETATAFRVFNKMRVPYGIVEVGMGGATDATNAMKQKSVTIISKIGLDHQEYLGNTIENIAKVKAGIMQKGVPCIVDHTNKPSVIHVLRKHAREVGTDIILTWKGEPLLLTLDNSRWMLESYQVQNLLCAAMAFRHLFPLQEINLDRLMETEPFLPGRLETVEVDASLSGLEPREILVDGAHNMLGITELRKHVNKRLRRDDQPVTWVMGMSQSKDKPFFKMMERLVEPQDNFAMVEFTQGPNDPQPLPASFGAEYAKMKQLDPGNVYSGKPDIAGALPWACKKSDGGPLVVTGSLYLIRQLLSLKGIRRRRHIGTRRPGRSQLYRYSRIARERNLTYEESREFKQARRHHRLSPIRSDVFALVPEGGPIQPLNVPVKTRELQRMAAFHQKQGEGYRMSIAAIKRDMERQTKDTDKPEKAVENIASRLEDLEAQAAKHKAAYDDAMFKIRGYRALPHMKYKSHRQVFGYPATPKAPTKSPFEPKSKKRKGKSKGSEKDNKESFKDQLAAAEKQRALEIKQAKMRESGDSFEAKVAADRKM
ncbi:tetrahydrofolylpolyglutamate synthase [Fusarium tjaetaba]|uniref:Tetrahydrofolylpolyglutamate synthase n=1 Tax=Fusarium tjaetaba TaxID=1567544 RepID=A0A8H5VWU6_9HYPO|nr:tetrahydrofolylpolyglutamate synthase [Fusarium tjaetaba]KAF5637248.1 tetrahydrofolylpolyglutamate synthase [Fusarium tjaetaba]